MICWTDVYIYVKMDIFMQYIGIFGFGTSVFIPLIATCKELMHQCVFQHQILPYTCFFKGYKHI